MRRIGLFPAALLIILLALGSCSKDALWQTATGTRGETVRWTPPQPQVGDLVRVEAGIPENGNAGESLRESGSPPMLPLNYEFSPGGKKLFWAFRVTRAGEWFFGPAGSPVKLWSVATVAGDAKELKTVDAQSLWSGKKPQAKAAP